MKTQPTKEDWKSPWPLPPISYKTDVTIGNNSTEKSDSLNIDIKTKPVERDSEAVVIYVPMLRTWSPEALLKFVTILNKIISGQDLSTGIQKFGMTRNLIIGEALQVLNRRIERGGRKRMQTMSWWWRTSSPTSFLRRCFSARIGTSVRGYTNPATRRS